MADGIYFEAKSEIDGAPLFVIIRGRRDCLRAAHGKANSKTGAMVQSYIVRRDISPGDAARSGADESVCGNCVHRPILARESGAARCYVNLAHGPRVCWEAVHRGAYRRVNLLGAAAYVRGLKLRIGSYGDPGAVPAVVWQVLSAAAADRTGYTHRWQDTGADLRGIVMASVDSVAERDAALALGWATFRVAMTADEARARIKGEAQCPASAEAGKRVVCADCPLKCDGATGGRVIIDHGPGGEGQRIARAKRAV
jgi:hypothetical protein